MITNWKQDLFKEKSLYEVYRASKKLPKSAHNKFVYMAAGLVIAVCVIIWISRSDVASAANAVNVAADIAFNLSVQILGFLIGGFAIFATVTDDRLMIRLAQAPMSEGGPSVFKHVFFNFLSVFHIYIVTLGISAAIKLASSVYIVDTSIIASWPSGPRLLAGINAAAFALLGAHITLAVVRLKSFIWNIYQGFITFLSVSEMMDQEAKKSQEGANPTPPTPQSEQS